MKSISEISDEYRDIVTECARFDSTEDVAASVIVTTYQTPRDELSRALEGLETQTIDDFEMILVDNGNSWNVRSTVSKMPYGTGYLSLNRNHGVTVGRNLGGSLASGDLLIFLDDDATPDNGFVKQHLRAHTDNDIIAARGRVRPKRETVFNQLQSHYDLGDEPRPYYINVEGNSSFDREAFLSFSGFDEGLTGRAGYEGAELSHRIASSMDRSQVIYHPEPIIYHDYATGFTQYLRKRIALEESKQQLIAECPALWGFITSYRTQPDAVPDRDRSLFMEMKENSIKFAGDLVTDLVTYGP